MSPVTKRLIVVVPLYNFVTASCDQRKIRSKLTLHPSMILVKYLSAESVKRRSEKPPRERERDEHVKKTGKTAEIDRNHGVCLLKSWFLQD